MGRFDDYCTYLSKYVALYGEQTTVLYQCGMFHEIYGVDNDKEQIGNVKILSDLLGIQLTRVKKAIVENSRTNPQMTGFPSVNIDKYTMILLQNNWTVVVVDQEKDEKGNVTRKVSNVWSPGTYIKTPNDISNFIVSIRIRQVPQRLTGTDPLYHVGLSCIDVTTGISHTHECYSTKSDSNYAIDETVRFIQAFQPKELLFDSSISDETIVEMLGIDVSLTKTYFNPDACKELDRLEHQESYLSDIYPDHGIISTIEYLDLELYTEARKSFVTLLRFCEAHSRSIIGGLKKPSLLVNGSNLVLDNNAVSQLNIIGSNKSIIKIMTSSSTNMGKRLIRERLLNPVVDIDEIDHRYSLVEFMQSEKNNGELWWESIEKQLKTIVDTERYHRKISMKMLEPIELASLMQSYRTMLTLFESLKGTPLEFLEGNINKLKLVVRYLSNSIDEEEACKYNVSDIVDSFFTRGYSLELDELSDKVRSIDRKMHMIAHKLSSFIEKGSNDKVKLKKHEKNGYYLDITKKRFTVLSRNFKTLTINESHSISSLDEFSIDKKNKSNVKISGGLISILSFSLSETIEKLKLKAIQTYHELLDRLTQKYQKFFSMLDNHIAQIDLYKSCAKLAVKNNYCKPEILTDNKSQIHAIGLRHPIIEKLVRKTKYVPASLSLEEDGMLLYGINASGKSSTMKAVGISIVLAQAGFYVSAVSFKFHPYQTLMTRIVGNDNIFKGLSSFAVEMSELRGILSRANSKTLVLGDEICHGTETGSAISLVTASLKSLSHKRSSYIFATHLHQLSNMEEITSITNLKQYHLTMHYDESLDEIIYDRILKPGPGPSNYGIEVARAMKIPQSIIDDANKIRNKYFGVSTEIKQSRYNPRSLIKICQIDDCDIAAEDSHHIRFQCETTDSGSLTNGEHKNVISNLVSLCKKHHNMVHRPVNNKLVIFGYSESGKLRYQYRKTLKSMTSRTIRIVK